MEGVVTLRIDIERGLAIAKQMRQTTDQHYMFDGGLNQVEFLIHEIGHAISLGLDTDPVSWAAKEGRIDHAVSVALGSPLIIATMEEAFVLAAEAVLFAGLGEPIDRYTLSETAWIQRVSDGELADALGSQESECLAGKMLAWAQTHGIVTEAG
jgi:hypothetical protein